jgi:hypothetical protein
MKTKWITIAIGMTCLLGGSNLAHAQYTFGVPTQIGGTHVPPPSQGR